MADIQLHFQDTVELRALLTAGIGRVSGPSHPETIELQVTSKGHDQGSVRVVGMPRGIVGVAVQEPSLGYHIRAGFLDYGNLN